MKKLSTLAMAASVLMMPFAANAAPPTGTYAGIVDVYKGIALECVLSVDVDTDVNGDTWAENLKLSMGDFLCPLVFFNNQPYEVEDNGGNVYTIKSVNVSTITPGDCAGDISVVVDLGPPVTITISGSLPASGGGGDCTVNGVLEQQ